MWSKSLQPHLQLHGSMFRSPLNKFGLYFNSCHIWVACFYLFMTLLLIVQACVAAYSRIGHLTASTGVSLLRQTDDAREVSKHHHAVLEWCCKLREPALVSTAQQKHFCARVLLLQPSGLADVRLPRYSRTSRFRFGSILWTAVAFNTITNPRRLTN